MRNRNWSFRNLRKWWAAIVYDYWSALFFLFIFGALMLMFWIGTLVNQ